MKTVQLSRAVLLALFVSGTALAAKTDVTIGMQLEPPILDPTAGAAAAIDEVVYANIFEGLTRFGPDGGVRPGLAKSWEISEDGLTYTFVLREGVSFHDSSEFNADDVVFSIKRAMADDSTNAQKQLFANIKNVEKVGKAAVITLNKPDGNLLFNLAWGDAVMIASETVDSLATSPVGTGPFQFMSWRQGDQIVLERNPNYWGTPVKLEKATFKFISEPTAAFAAIMAGDLDAFPNYPAPENLDQLNADPRFSVVLGTTEGETILAMNNQQPPMHDRLVRQAISHAIDRTAIIDGAMYGYGTPIGTHFAPHNPAYLDLTAKSEYDPVKAKALLREAGLPDGFSTTLKLPPPAYARRGGEIIAAQLRAVGITVEIVNLEWAQWLEQVFKGKDFGMTIVSHTEPMDIGIYAKPDYYFQYDNSTLQGLWTLYNAEAGDAKRTEILQQMQKIIADDYVNVYLFQLAKTGVANSKLQGLWVNAPTQANDLTGVYWEE